MGWASDPARWRGALVVLFASALGWKLAALWRYAHSADFGLLSADASIYSSWAQLIRRQGWLGHEPFFLGPLYPYLLSLLDPGAGGSIVPPLVFQCVLGAATCVLIAIAARRLCRPEWAIATGALAAANTMATFLDLSILSESVLWFLGAAFLVLQLEPRTGTRHSLGSGVLVGLMALARPSNLLLLGSHAVGRGGLVRGARAMGIAALAATCVCLPVMLRHVALGYGPIWSTYSLGYNLYVGNGPGATGAYQERLDDASNPEAGTPGDEGGTSGDGRELLRRTRGLTLSALGSSAYWLRETGRQAAERPWVTARTLVRKMALSVNHVETTQLDSAAVRAGLEGPLGAPLLGGFALLAVLALAGLFVLRGRREVRIVTGYAVAVWLPMIVFFVTDRYRHHLTLPLIVACGPALESVWIALRHAGAMTTARTWAPPLGVAAALVALPLVPAPAEQNAFATHVTLAAAYLSKGQAGSAASQLEPCLVASRLARLPVERSRSASSAVARAWHLLGGCYAQQGMYVQGEAAMARGLPYAPGMLELHVDHAVLLAITGRVPAAEAEFDSLAVPRRRLVDELVRIARSGQGSTKPWVTEQSLRAALAVDSTSASANVIMLRLLIGEGRTAEARAWAERLPGRGVRADAVSAELALLH